MEPSPRLETAITAWLLVLLVLAVVSSLCPHHIENDERRICRSPSMCDSRHQRTQVFYNMDNTAGVDYPSSVQNEVQDEDRQSLSSTGVWWRENIQSATRLPTLALLVLLLWQEFQLATLRHQRKLPVSMVSLAAASIAAVACLSERAMLVSLGLPTTCQLWIDGFEEQAIMSLNVLMLGGIAIYGLCIAFAQQ